MPVGKGIQAHRQRACRRARSNSSAWRRARAEDAPETSVRVRRRIGRAVRHAGAIATPPTWPPMPPTNVGAYGALVAAKIRDLRRNDVVEDAESQRARPVPWVIWYATETRGCHTNSGVDGNKPRTLVWIDLIERLSLSDAISRETIPLAAQTAAADSRDWYSMSPARRR